MITPRLFLSLRSSHLLAFSPQILVPALGWPSHSNEGQGRNDSSLTLRSVGREETRRMTRELLGKTGIMLNGDLP